MKLYETVVVNNLDMLLVKRGQFAGLDQQLWRQHQ